jgi:hypothetical protein
MTVAVADFPLALVLWQVTVGGKAIDPAGPWGDNHVAWSWAFVPEQSMRLRPGCWSGWLAVGYDLQEGWSAQRWARDSW